MPSIYPDSVTRTACGSNNLVELLRQRALSQPESLAYTFLSDGETTEVNLSYGELDAQARAIAATLQGLGARGERVLLLYPQGLEYIAAFFGCLYAGVVAVPAYPPRLNQSLGRLKAIVDDAQATTALTTRSLITRISPLCEEIPELNSLRWVATDEVPAQAATQWHEPEIDGETLAFLQYTSGSTAAPRGVMVSHDNLLDNERLIQRAFRQTEGCTIVGWLPLYHDMGLIGNVLQPMYLGARCILMSPAAFLQRPSRWLEAISRYRATTSGGPNFAYELCARKITPARRETLDLSSWSVAFNGAEPVRQSTLELFASAFEPHGFRREAFSPCYGLAESTLLIAGGPKSSQPLARKFRARELAQSRVVEACADEEATALVGCVMHESGQRLVIVNPDSLLRCDPDEVGEIWVCGPSVSGGYWNRAEATEEVFQARLSGEEGGPFLRTGDLGFVRDGELFVTGRLKDLIIIRGLNHYPQEIEQTAAQCHAALRGNVGAAFSVEADGEEQLVVVHEVDHRQGADPDELVSMIRAAVSETHELQAHAVVLVRAGGVPRTTSGKVQRRACREGFLAGTLKKVLVEWHYDAEGARAESETLTKTLMTTASAGDSTMAGWLRSRLAARLRLNPAQIELERSLASYGLDSLSAVELAHDVEAEFGVVLPLADFFQKRTILELATELADARIGSGSGSSGGGGPAPVPAGEAVNEYALSLEHPLSRGQQALWYLQQMAPGNAAYNISSAVRIFQQLDVAALRRAYQFLVDRHAALRTTFTAASGEPLQKVHQSAQVCFEEFEASAWSEAALRRQLADEAHRPFDLEGGPLLRVSLFKRSEHEHVLLMVVHHIVADLWSLATLTHELGLAYEAEAAGTRPGLAPPRLQFTDYVRWQEEMLAGPEAERLRTFWVERLAGASPVINLPTDRARPQAQSYSGAALRFKLGAVLTQRLKTLGQRHDATLYMTLLAAFELLLARYTGQDDLLVGSLTSGRSRAELASVIGYFVNPVVLRARVAADTAFSSFLEQVRACVIETFAHQDYPFPTLVEQVQPEREPNRSPLFQSLFVLQKSQLLQEDVASLFNCDETARLRLGSLEVSPLAVERRAAQFDLSLLMTEARGELAGSFEFSTDLFDATTIERMTRHFETLLEAIAADPTRTLSELQVLTDAERRRVLEEWNATDTGYARTHLLPRLFEEQVERTPEQTALIFEDERLSYRELNRRANLLAHRLRSLGVGPEVTVGVLMQRSVEMVVGLLAILKAGGAYVPIDADYPPERIAFMLEDARPPVLLSQKGAAVPDYDGTVLLLDAECSAVAGFDDTNPRPSLSEENLAYVIYTSGSTGRPKGAMNSHRAICNRLLWMQEVYGLTSADRVLQKTPASFDVSVWEFFWPLICGAGLVLARPGGHQDSGYLASLIAEELITTVHFVPSMLRVFVEEPGIDACRDLRRVICSGEALPFSLQERFHQRSGADLHNLYGPTEAAVDVTFWHCERRPRSNLVPIGRPIANTQIYILDRSLQPVPLGVAADLYIGGVGVARGYYRRPALTAEKFIPDPFSKRPGARLYKTGDMARHLPEGEIEFLGRLDHQIKVRGFRIELGEIEAALVACAGVREAVVLAEETKGGDKRLVAYLVTQRKGSPTTAEMRSHLRKRLPEYMVPFAFVTLERMPLMPNGKIDRRVLATFSPKEPARLYQAPATPIEVTLAEIWCEVLEVERVGRDDNFFDLGGHSLLATQAVSRVRQAYQTDIPMSVLYAGTPLLKEMAAAIELYLIEQAGAEEIDDVLDDLKDLSDEEIRALLAEEQLLGADPEASSPNEG